MHEDNCAVYVHVNLINGKKYFGITTQEPEMRWKNGHGYYNNAHFTNAINKYGWNNFAHYVLYRNIPINIAKNIEEMLIQEHFSYDPRFGYNKTMGGELEIPTEEARKKMSEAKKGNNNPMKCPEARKKMIKSQHKRPVEALDIETMSRIYYFESIHDAERSGFDRAHIRKCCKGKIKTHKNLIWRYVEEVNDDDSDN